MGGEEEGAPGPENSHRSVQQAQPSGQLSGMASPRSPRSQDEDEDEVVETDYAGRFSRYRQVVGSGRFKTVYRGFDEKRGIDVAWSKIDGTRNELSLEQMHEIVEEISKGLKIDHNNVIKLYQCWYDEQANAINMITEFFTGGNLREYRQRCRQLGMQAVKKWGRQILQGLAYLHSRDPPLVHGDLRPDKIYIHGHSGEIKIGDLGLAALVPKRFPDDVMPEGALSNQYTRSVDIFAFGLVMLELVTNKRINVRPGDDAAHPSSLGTAAWEEALSGVQDEAVRSFISRCLGPADQRPTAADLLNYLFLKPEPPPKPVPAAQDSKDLQRSRSDLATGDGGSDDSGVRMERRPGSEDDAPETEAGHVRGEDYWFHFTGKIRDGKHHFRLQMVYDGEGGPEDGTSKTIDFVFDPEEDTADAIAAEISSEFNLSDVDTDLCAAALKEFLDRLDQGVAGDSPR